MHAWGKFNIYFLRSLAVGAPISAYSFYQSDEGVRRSLQFYSIAFPAYLHYELVDRFGDPVKRDENFLRLHKTYSPLMHANVVRMRGFFLKAAQLMSVREDYLPEEYLQWTRLMQSEAPVVFGPEEAKKIICQELGLNSIGELFSEFQDTPVGSASIGQVYRGVLREDVSGHSKVAIKVQSPNVERQFRSDLQACKLFCRIAMPHLLVSLDEIEKQFMTEFDYAREAQNLLEVGSNMVAAAEPWKNKVVVPKPVLSLCTKRVLVMDFVEGKKISDIFTSYLEDRAAKESKPVDVLKKELQEQVMKKGLIDMHQSRKFRKIQLWMAKAVPYVTLGLYQPPSYAQIDPFDLLTTAMEVHGYQIFCNRTFNGDPHPGNLMLTPDNKLALIDFGQVKRLSEKSAADVAKLVMALSTDDVDLVASVLASMGCKNEKNIPEVMYRMAAFWLDRDTPDITLGLDLHKFLAEMERRDPQKVLCEDLVMVGRCSVMLRSLGLSMGLRVRTTDFWKKYANMCLINSTEEK